MSSSAPGKGEIYRFDDVLVDCENFRVQRHEGRIILTPRAFDVLVFLLKNAGHVVEKQELFDQIWKRTFVSDNALTKVVKEIRHALEDPADQPRYIETIPKRGYRFAAELTAANGDRPEQGAVPAAGKIEGPGKTGSHAPFSSAPVHALVAIMLISVSVVVAWLWLRGSGAETRPSAIRAIAVLPFRPLDADSRDESLELGMAETLITRLSNLRQVSVRPVTAVREYTDEQSDPAAIGREIGAEAVLCGSIQKAGDRIRVTVRLVETSSGEPLWSDQFDESFTDIFSVQDAIGERVSNALSLQLSRQERELLAKRYTNNPDAYQLYLRAQLVWHRRRERWIDESLAYYQAALEKDPDFALAHVGEAECYIMLSGHRRISMQEAETKARPGIMRALEIDDTLAQAHNALAELKYQYEFDWARAETEFERAIELNPNVAWIRQAHGWFLMSQGRFDDAAAEMEKAQELDPSSLTINAGRGRLFYYSRRYDEALQQFQNILAAEPNDRASGYALLDIYEQKQMYPEALDIFLKLNNIAPATAAESRSAYATSGWPGFLRKQVERLEAVHARTGRVSPSTFAQLYARLGERDKAFFWFEKLFETRDVSMLQFKIEPAYDSLRDDPRYAQLVRKLGLEP